MASSGRRGAGRVELERVLGGAPDRVELLAAGRTGDVLRVERAGRAPLVAKLDDGGAGGLPTEAEGLVALARAGAPAPRVEHASPHLLLMEWRPGSTGVGEPAAEAAAVALHTLHAAGHAAGHGPFGYPHATRIGGLVQPNGARESWLGFFAEERLLRFAWAARDEGRLGPAEAALVERVAARLPELAAEPDRPALLHGDLWSGNVLTDGARLTAFLDPAPYRGHPEVDLAFATMFGGFPRRFFDAYGELDPGVLDQGFWAERRDLWNLYPLLVHVRLFGGGYVGELVRAARRFA